jgi:hypothetical protein
LPEAPAHRDRRSRTRTAASAGPLIARERELAELRGALDAALGGSGRVVLLGGEPGIGKTRLTTVLADEAESRGVPVWWGRGWEDGPTPPFWPWNTALRRWMDQVGADAVAAAAGSVDPRLARIFPVLCDYTLGCPSRDSWDGDAERLLLLDVACRFLAAIARPAGLVVVLDDIHWTDRSSLRLLEFIAANLSDMRLLIVATYRDTELHGEAPFLSTLSRITREPSTRRLLVSGLSPAQCARWIALAEPRGDAAALGETLHRETNGNPFFVGEIVRFRAAGQELATGRDAQRVPPAVREVVGHRLERLGDACRVSLSVAALFGEAVDAGMLADVLGDVPVADHLERAVHDRILIEDEDCPGRYAFAHVLVRRVLVDALLPSARSAWHARIATVLERREGVATALVHHLVAAGTREAQHKAFDHACRSARHAERALGWDEAVRLYEVALDVGGRWGLLDSRHAIEVRLALARALRRRATLRRRGRGAEVMAAARRTVDPEAFARAARVHADRSRSGDGSARGAGGSREASRAGSILDDALRARLHARLASDLIAASQVAHEGRIAALCDDAHAAARRAGGGLAVAVTATVYAADMGIRPVPSARGIPETAEAEGDDESAATFRCMRAMTFLATGEPEASRGGRRLATAAAACGFQALWLARTRWRRSGPRSGDVCGAGCDGTRRRDGCRMQLLNAGAVYRTAHHVARPGPPGRDRPEIESLAERTRAAVVGVRSGHSPGWPEATRRRPAEFGACSRADSAPAERGVMARRYLAGLAAFASRSRPRARAFALRPHRATPRVWIATAARPSAVGAGARRARSPVRAAGGCGAAFRDRDRLGQRMGSPPIVVRAQPARRRPPVVTSAVDERERVRDDGRRAERGAREFGLVDVKARAERLQGKLAGSADVPVNVPARRRRLDGALRRP